MKPWRGVEWFLFLLLLLLPTFVVGCPLSFSASPHSVLYMTYYLQILTEHLQQVYRVLDHLNR